MPLGLSPIEVGIIVLIVVVLFGANQLPKIARSSGRQLKQSKEAVGSFKEEFDKGMADINPVSGVKDAVRSVDPREALKTEAPAPKAPEAP